MDFGVASVDFLEEVGVDEGEYDHADAFDAHNNVLVFFHALHVAFGAGVEAAGHSHPLVFTEVGAGVDAAACCVVAGKKPQQVNRLLGYDLNLAVVGIAIDPHRYGGRIGAPFGFETQCVGACGFYEQYMRYHSLEAGPMPVGRADLFGKEHFAALCREGFLGSKVQAGLYGKPVFGFGRGAVAVHVGICLTLMWYAAAKAFYHISHDRPSVIRFGSQSLAYTGTVSVVGPPGAGFWRIFPTGDIDGEAAAKLRKISYFVMQSCAIYINKVWLSRSFVDGWGCGVAGFDVNLLVTFF